MISSWTSHMGNALPTEITAFNKSYYYTNPFGSSESKKSCEDGFIA
jgi:hypothetical protein